MNFPKIKNVKVINETSLLKKEMFKPLKDPILFNSVKIDIGGYALIWNENIDISEHELWTNGLEVTSDKVKKLCY
ncbi:MAG: DUF2442 domain-containing protein [Candidatus Marinimicrobia bacterium]|nr:DUF2442 domain-containing protein [Candidatus Neomarinimicrobiota bacterium]